LLPIPNRTVKRLRADDSGRTSVKVGHRQAFIAQNPTGNPVGFCFFGLCFYVLPVDFIFAALMH
ncbi:hypothetical protein, partial [Achromobacter spanius]|uniref:hypothetical protein n=1 Tax=Achromobacter spanius TaxID=217203 RepID=UPI003A91B9DE